MPSSVVVSSQSSVAWGAPNVADFESWVMNMMGVPTSAMPDAITLQMAYDTALNLALDDLMTIPFQPGTPSLYAIAVYNLGGAILIDIAQDDPTSIMPTYWSDLRTKFNVTMFSFTIITGAADQGTSKSGVVPAFVQQMGPLDLWLMQTPFGRMYLMIAGAWGAVWGLS